MVESIDYTNNDVFIEKNKHHGYVSKIFKSTDTWSAGIFTDAEYNYSFRFISKFKVELNKDVILVGQWVDNTYNGNVYRQFEAEYVEQIFNFSEAGLYKFLKNNSELKGIGDKTAQKIAKKFHKNFDHIITNQPNELCKLGIRKDIVQNLQKKWLESKYKNEAMVALSDLPIPQNIINKLVSSYGVNANKVIRDNPYVYINKIDGFGFKLADAVAMHLNFSKTDVVRIQACLEYIVFHVIQNGYDGSHTWIEFSELIQQSEELLDIESSYIVDFFKNNLDESNLIVIEDDNLIKVCHRYVYYQEEYVIKHIMKIKDNSLLSNGNELYKLFSNELETLNEKQKQAILNALNYDFSIITGKAGTGKTFVLKNLLNILKYNYNVCLVAPTGKAARRITESTGYTASTIHKLLQYNSMEYLYNEDNKIYDYDIYIIDEFSMISNDLAYRLFAALPDNVKIIAVGDPNQLPPIGPGILFKHLIETKNVDFHITELTDIIRQDGSLKYNSVKILDNEIEYEKTDDWEVLCDDAYDKQTAILNNLLNLIENRQKYLNEEYIDNIQIISPTKKGLIGTYNLNVEIQYLIQSTLYNVFPEETDPEKPKFYLHDKVIQTVNDYNIDVMNGTIGKIVYLDKKSGIMKIHFENDVFVEYEKNDEKLDNINLGYALTIHKTQGSEFPIVLVVMHKNQYIMLNKNLLYTAVTRAKNKVCIISDKKALNIAISKSNQIHKRTNYYYILNSILKT